MFNLLAKQSSRKNTHTESVEEEEKKLFAAADTSLEDNDTVDENQEFAASSSSSHSDTSAFDLSSSPLGLVSSLSSSLLSSAKQKVSSAVTAGGDAAKIIKRGMEQGAAEIERATRGLDEDPSFSGDASAKQKNSFIEKGLLGWHKEASSESSSDEKAAESKGASNNEHRRLSWSQMKHPDEKERVRESPSSPSSLAASAASASSPAAPNSSPLSAVDDIQLRMNFLRLLHRCEEISFQHMHPSAGIVPILQISPVSGLHCREALVFFKNVALLQKEFLPELRKRALVISPPKENGEFMRRVAFLATLAEKEHQEQTEGPSIASRRKGERKKMNTASIAQQLGLPTMAYGVHSIRSSTALLAAASASSAAGTTVDAAANSVPPVSPPSALDLDDTADSLLDRALPTDHTQELRAALFARSREKQAHISTSASDAASSSKTPEFSAEEEQNRLVNELHEMTASLKSNALRMRTAMQSDAKVLSEAEELLDRNLSSVQHENSRLKTWASAGCSEMFWNILLIITVWAVFIGMFIFMKIFHKSKE